VGRVSGRARDAGDRYRQVRRWYARDRGRTTLLELIELLEGSAEKARAA
jgi:hypothetical protein